MKDRLGDEKRRQLVEERQAGITLKMLAQKYGVSVSSTRRLLGKFE